MDRLSFRPAGRRVPRRDRNGIRVAPYSIISSTRIYMPEGISTPISFAILRLRPKANRVGLFHGQIRRLCALHYPPRKGAPSGTNDARVHGEAKIKNAKPRADPLLPTCHASRSAAAAIRSSPSSTPSTRASARRFRDCHSPGCRVNPKGGRYATDPFDSGAPETLLQRREIWCYTCCGVASRACFSSSG
jgi:hypothetical protein